MNRTLLRSAARGSRQQLRLADLGEEVLAAGLLGRPPLAGRERARRRKPLAIAHA